jgi:hypothetical protein
MNHSNRIPTDTVDEDEASLVGAQMVVFSSGNWLSREAFQELATPTAPRGVEFFKLLVRTTIALEERRAGLLSTVSRNTPADSVELLGHWLGVHALGHLALLSFRGELAWFAEMLREVTVKRWTPTHALVRERLMSVALRGAWAAGRLGETALALYLPVLRSPAERLEHFDAALALAMVSLKHPHLAPLARPALDQWASHATGSGRFRKELMESVAFLLDDPNGARIWSMGWSRRVLSLHGTRNEQTLLAKAESLSISQDELLILTALNDVGDCGIFVGGLFPAVLLLSHVHRRGADEFYAPSRIVPVVTHPWTPESSLDVLRRSVPAVDTARDSASGRSVS